jgi:glutathione S-transferase
MPATLYVVHGSHPCAAVARALDLKGLPYRTVELLPPLHAALQRARFGTRTVPSIRLETGEKISGSRAIMRRLDELAPEPPLLPGDPAEREAVLRAEEWGDQVYQPIARRLLWATLARCPEAMASYQAGSRYPRLPAPALRAAAPVVTGIERRLNDATDPAVRADLRSLHRHLDRIDGWIGDGVLGGRTINAADLQIATSSRLILTIGDVRPLYAGRPAETHARRLFPDWPGTTPPSVFPNVWLDEAQAAV